MEIFYKKWKTQKGNPFHAQIIEGLGYELKNGSLLTIVEDNIRYNVSKYKVFNLSNNRIEIALRREPIEESWSEDSVPWEYNKYPIKDGNPYIGYDTPEEVLRGLLNFPREEVNKTLKRYIESSNKFEVKLLSLIEGNFPKRLKKGFKLYLDFYTKPELRNKKLFKEWAIKEPFYYLKFKEILKWD